MTFHSRGQEEVLSCFTRMHPLPHQLLHLPTSWKRWATADREPIGRWSYGRSTLPGDVARPLLHYLAQGAFIALERSRVARTARVVLMTREFGRLCHASGVERLVRNDLWKGPSPERFYDALEWLYGWRADHCLAD